MNRVRTDSLTIMEKLSILADAAKYDAACTSSGVDRRGKTGCLGNSAAAGICHSFAGDGRCISLLKILLSNDCAYDCRYCINRASNDRPRATFSPDEVCRLVTEFYRRNYIEGLFLSSGVCRTPSYTMERMYEAVYLLRTKYRFNGYVHVKVLPGASPELIAGIGRLADRMSVNLELPTGEALRTLAPNKTRRTILAPMRQIQQGIAASRLAAGKPARLERAAGLRYLPETIFDSAREQLERKSGNDRLPGPPGSAADRPQEAPLPTPDAPVLSPVPDAHMFPAGPFSPAGQSTQMIIGATPETDYQLLLTAQHLYQQFDLKRVFYSAYVPVNDDPALPAPGTAPPLLREHRLYQADWLLRCYGFHAGELLDEGHPSFNVLLDPKCDWALRHLEQFPVEVNRADYAALLRVPGIGTKSAMRIVKSRRGSPLTFDALRKIGVVLKRAKYFITCGGKMMYRIPIEEDYLTRQLTGEEARDNWETEHPRSFRQLSLFDDFHMERNPGPSDLRMSLTGQL